MGRKSSARAAGAIESCALVRAICGEPEQLTPDDVTAAARLAEQHGLTFHDASYAAIATRKGWQLVSADRRLLEPGLAIDVATALAAAA